MARPRLTSLLIAINAGLVLAAVIGVAALGARVLRQMADRQAVSRVSLAALAALQAIDRAGDYTETAARLLGERPLLRPLLAAEGTGGLGPYLDRFRRTGGLSGAAVFRGDRLLSAAGAAGARGLPWAELRRAAAAAGPGRYALAAGAGGELILGGVGQVAPGAASPATEVVTALRLDPPFVRRLADQTGLPITLVSAQQARDEAVAQSALRQEVLGQEHGEGAARRVEGAGLYLALQPLRAPAGAVVGLVEAGLPVAEVTAPLERLTTRLLLLALVVAVGAIAASSLAGRFLEQPVRDLTAAASRLGRGDLATPVPRTPGPELGTLAATLEEARRQLLRLTAELRLRQAEGEAILTGIAEGVMSVDRDRRIRYLNPQAAALLGVEPAAALGRFCGDVLHPQAKDGVRPCEEQCPILHSRFRGGTRATELLQPAGGPRRSVVITSAPPVEERQVLVLRDETDLESARRQRDAVLANISHELRTPLAAQRASLELLREHLAAVPGDGDPAVDGLVLALERGSLRLTQLIDNLLESVRIESGQDAVRRRPVALDEVVEEAVELTAPLVAQRGQRFAIDLPYPLPPVPGDAPRLIQVFVNLIANAQKFGPDGSTIRLGGAVSPQAVTLWVEDEGPGLPPFAAGEDRSPFSRFVRAAGAEEPEQGGMGLGLWIVRSIVERHGGSVDAEATASGPGTRMRVVLRRAPEGEEVSA